MRSVTLPFRPISKQTRNNGRPPFFDEFSLDATGGRAINKKRRLRRVLIREKQQDGKDHECGKDKKCDYENGEIGRDLSAAVRLGSHELPRLELITLAPNSLYAPVLFPVGILDLFSDPLDVNVNGT